MATVSPLDELKKEIKEVLEETNSIPLCTFWNSFRNKFDYLPDPNNFGYAKRSSFFDRFDDIVTLVGKGNERAVKLRQSSSKKVKAKGKQFVGDSKEPDTSKSQPGVTQRSFGTSSKPGLKTHPPTSAVIPFEDSSSENSEGLPEEVMPGSRHHPYSKSRRSSERRDDMKNSWGGSDGAGSSSASITRPGMEQKQTASRNAPQIQNQQVYAAFGGAAYAFPTLKESASLPQSYGNHVPPHSHNSYQNQSYRSYNRESTRYRENKLSHHQAYQQVSSIQASKEQLDDVAEDAIERLVESKEYISAEKIEKLVLQHYSIASLQEIQGVRRLEDIPIINAHVRKQCKANAYIQAFARVRPVATLHELGQNLKEFVPDEPVDNFEELKLGPLQKQPLVYQFFKFPPDCEIPDIDTFDVIEMLRDYLTEKNKWTSRDLNMQEFMIFIKEAKGLENPYESGVKIKSLPLAVQVIKRSQRECGAAMRNVITQQRESLQDDIVATFKHFASNVLTKQVGYCVVKKEYLTMNAPEVILDVCRRLHVFMTKVQEHFLPSRAERKMVDQLRSLQSLLMAISSSNKMVEALLRLAICCSEEEIHQQLWGVVERTLSQWKAREQEVIVLDDDDEGGGQSPQKSRQRPNLGDVTTKMCKYLERCLTQGPLTLVLLSKVETKLCEDYEFSDFRDLGHGSFLDLLTQGELKKYLDERGGCTLGGVQKGVGTSDSLYHVSQHDLIEFVKQCDIKDTSQLSRLEWAVCNHYGVKDVKSLGLGTAKHLYEGQGRGVMHRGKEPSVFYQSALCTKDSSLTSAGTRQVGILGHQTREAALACLQNCPLVADLADWSHWSLVFEPELGPLKEFVQKYGRVHSATVTDKCQKFTMTTHILAMETKPGVLLKISSDSSSDKFAQAAEAEDIQGTCGHLMSLLAMNKGLETLPTALLGNHMKTALFKIQASSGVDHVPAGPMSHRQPQRVCQFVVECLTTLPLHICQVLATKIFLEPLASVIGKAKSKDLLLAAAVTTAQQSRLQVLGCLLGVNEWTASFEERKKYPRDCMQKVETMDDGMGGIIESTLDSEPESSGDEDDPEDTGTITLSDDEEDLNDTVKGPTAGKSQRFGSVKGTAEDKVEETEVIVLNEPVHNNAKDKDILGVAMATGDPGHHSAGSELIQGSGVRMSPYRAVIEQIRREEFGVSVVLSEDGQRLMQKQQERLGRSLDRLSRDLYSKDTHFVLELIQNADDNDYPQEMFSQGFNMSPSVEFVVEDDCITVLNNESGFQEQNVKALCDVGRSTKGKHKYGYIGQKGIGFKSVFRVTDRPEIHSNGYHICFDVDSGPMGYILPHWIGKVRKVKVKKTKTLHSEGVTDGLEQDTKSDLTSAIKPVSDQEAVIDLVGDSEGSENMDDVELIESEEAEVVAEDADMVEEFEEIEEEVEEDTHDNQWTTRIVLPLKQEVRSQNQTLSLAARFHDVHPSLLLFLHRLRRLSIRNQVEAYNLDITRRDLPNNIVEIQYQDTTDRWLVVKQTLDASRISKQAKSGVEVESTEIALAFQLQCEQNTQVLPAKQPVFAFLPLRSYGFRFVIQGDFDVPSSREDVDRDSMWNQWILSQIHTLFVDSVNTFKSLPSLTEVQAVCSFLQFVPMEDEILDFFRPVASQIMQQLRARPCLPTQSAKGKAIQWKMPSQLVTTDDSLVREVVSSELLQTHLNLDYVHRGVVEGVSPSLLSSLGVQSLTTQHLMDIGGVIVDRLQAMDTDGDPVDRTSDIQTLSKWLTCIYRSLDEFQQNEELLSRLRNFAIIPLTDGQMVKLSEKTVFFPLADDRRKKHNKITLLIQTDINTIDKQLFSQLDDVSNSQVRRLLEKLGVKSLSPQDVVHHHIMPVLKSELWKEKPREIVFAYVMYIKQHYEAQEGGTLISIEELQPHLVVETNQGLKKPSETPIHFTPAYLNPIDLPKLLPGHKWVLLDAKYLQGVTSRAEVQKWYDFFLKLGVLNFLAVKQEEVTMTRKEMEDSPWEKFLDILPPMDKYKIMDCECSEFYSLVIENDLSDTKYSQMKILFLLLDQQYDSDYRQFTIARVMTPEGQFLKEIDSTFAMLLKQVPWLPAAVVTRQEGSDVGQVVGELMDGSEIYIRSPNTERLLSHHVPYLDANPSPKSTFSTFLGVRHSVKIEDVHELLIEWSSPDEEDENTEAQPRSFSTSLNHIKSVYSYLTQNLQPKLLVNLFRDKPVIFHTCTMPSSHEECVSGHFLSRDKVRWMDPSGLFQKYSSLINTRDFQKSCRVILSKLYPEQEFQDLFLRVAQIQKQPEYEEYARLLIELCAIIPLPSSLPDILKIYEIIGDGYLKVKSGLAVQDPESIKTLLKDKLIIPVKGNKLKNAEEDPLIADDREKEMQWKGKSGVNFVDLGDDKHRRNTEVSVAMDKVHAFLELLGIPRLSERIELEPTTESYRPCPQLQHYMHRVTPFIQQLLYHEHEDAYQLLLQRNIRVELSLMNFAQVSRLEMVQHLKIRSSPEPIIKNEKCRILNRDFFVHKDSVHDYTEIDQEIARFFCPNNKQTLRNMKHLLRELKDLVVNTTAELDAFMSHQNLEPLPDDEELWEVRAPTNWPPPPPTHPSTVGYGHQQMDMDVEQTEMGEQVSAADSQSEDTGTSKPLMQWPPPDPTRGRHRVDRSGEPPNPMLQPPAPADPINTSNLPSDLRPSRLAPYRESQPDREECLSSNPPETQSEPHSPHIGPRFTTPSVESDAASEKHMHRQHSSTVHHHPEGQGHVHEAEGQSGTEKTQTEGVEKGGLSHQVDSYKSGSSDKQPMGGEAVDSGEANGVDPTVHPGVAVDEQHSVKAVEFSRSQSQIEMEYIGSHGNQETIAVDENWIGEPANRNPNKRPRTESNGEDRQKKAPVVFYGNPVWTETANENLYKHLAQSSEIKVPDNIELENNAAPPEIGRWGESLVNSYLNQVKDNDPETDICEVLWVNEEAESGLPYDFMVKVRDSLTNELQPLYIEVKSTLSDKKAFFEISSQEFKFAQHWHEHFHVYRVFNAGSPGSVRLTKLANLSELLDKNQIKLCMVV